MRRVFIALLFSLAVPAIFWLGGYDFNERGEMAVLAAILWLFAWWCAWFIPVDYFGTKWYQKP